jgi:hypothetical protein
MIEARVISAGITRDRMRGPLMPPTMDGLFPLSDVDKAKWDGVDPTTETIRFLADQALAREDRISNAQKQLGILMQGVPEDNLPTDQTRLNQAIRISYLLLNNRF